MPQALVGYTQAGERLIDGLGYLHLPALPRGFHLGPGLSPPLFQPDPGSVSESQSGRQTGSSDRGTGRRVLLKRQGCD